MSGDIEMVYDNATQRADIVLESLNGKVTVDVETGADLQTAVMLSLMTDRVADDDWLLTVDRRGWWADFQRDQPIGSRIWELALITTADKNEYLMRAEAYCVEALQWLIDDQVASTVTANAYFTNASQTALGVDIKVTRQTGTNLEFSYVWDNIS